ncbi:hypothetical protein LCGC14_2675050, partial [marine sediment metagenome]
LKASCHRCGKCCIEVAVSMEWKRGFYDNRLKIHSKPKGCQALRFDKDIAVCTIQELYGYDAKPEQCKNWKCKE